MTLMVAADGLFAIIFSSADNHWGSGALARWHLLVRAQRFTIDCDLEASTATVFGLGNFSERVYLVPKFRARVLSF
jgi:hypothetical protein